MSVLSNRHFDAGYQDGKGGRTYTASQQSHTIERGRYHLSRALYNAGWELARCQKGIGKLPLLVHTGRRFFWVVAIEPNGLIFQATKPDERPSGKSGYRDLAALMKLKDEPLGKA